MHTWYGHLMRMNDDDFVKSLRAELREGVYWVRHQLNGSTTWMGIGKREWACEEWSVRVGDYSIVTTPLGEVPMREQFHNRGSFMPSSRKYNRNRSGREIRSRLVTILGITTGRVR